MKMPTAKSLLVLPLAAAAFGTPGSVWAQDAPLSSVETIAATCALCHGPGNTGSPGVEDLTDYSAAEFIEEMHELPSEAGEYRLMSVLARGYDAAQIRALGEYFEQARAADGEDDEEEGERHD